MAARAFAALSRPVGDAGEIDGMSGLHAFPDAIEHAARFGDQQLARALRVDAPQDFIDRRQFAKADIEVHTRRSRSHMRCLRPKTVIRTMEIFHDSPFAIVAGGFHATRFRIHHQARPEPWRGRHERLRSACSRWRTAWL